MGEEQSEGGSDMQPLQALNHLADLRFHESREFAYKITL